MTWGRYVVGITCVMSSNLTNYVCVHEHFIERNYWSGAVLMYIHVYMGHFQPNPKASQAFAFEDGMQLINVVLSSIQAEVLCIIIT